MTEAQWLACTDPLEMLRFLRRKVSERKLRLFTCACCRRIWHLLSDERTRKAVELAEKYADGQVSDHELATAHGEAWAASRRGRHRGLPVDASAVAECAAGAARDAAAVGIETTLFPPGDKPTDAEYAAFMAPPDAAYAAEGSPLEATDEVQAQTELISDIFGNPFRATPVIAPAWLTWNDSALIKLARNIYDVRILPEGTLDCVRLRQLADALEDAGCQDEDLLSHLRGVGPHVRGCFAVDWVLGKT